MSTSALDAVTLAGRQLLARSAFGDEQEVRVPRAALLVSDLALAMLNCCLL